MAQIAANPWSFLAADQGSTFALTSIVNQGESLLVTSAAHGFAVGSSGQAVSLQAGTIGAYAGGYRVVVVPSATTVLLQNQMKNRGLANTGATGNMVTAAYLDMIRAEQILWQPNAGTDTLSLTDIAGNIVWHPIIPAAAPPQGLYTYGKVFWIRGLVINAFTGTGNLQITVN